SPNPYHHPSDRVQNRSILFHKTLRSIIELRRRLPGPPVFAIVAMFVVQLSSLIKTMCDLVANEHAKCAIVYGSGRVHVEKGWQQCTKRDNYWKGEKVWQGRARW